MGGGEEGMGKESPGITSGTHTGNPNEDQYSPVEKIFNVDISVEHFTTDKLLD